MEFLGRVGNQLMILGVTIYVAGVICIEIWKDITFFLYLVALERAVGFPGVVGRLYYSSRVYPPNPYKVRP